MCVQGQYLLGLRGPAQCVSFDDGPMKVHLVPRNGGKPMASSSFLVVGRFTSSHCYLKALPTVWLVNACAKLHLQVFQGPYGNFR